MWDILGISPTGDVKEIKRAFAAKAEEYGLTKGSEGYARLEKARDTACACARRCRRTGNYPYRFMDSGFILVTEPDNEYTPIIHYSCEETKKRLLGRMRFIWSDEKRRNSKSCWNYFFGKDEDFVRAVNDTGFRREAAKLVYDTVLTPEAASAIARGFGEGSRAVPYRSGAKVIKAYFGIDKTPSEEWKVYIAVNGAPMPEKKRLTPEYKSSMPDDSRTVFGICCIIALLLIISVVSLFRSREKEEFAEKAGTARTVFTNNNGEEI